MYEKLEFDLDKWSVPNINSHLGSWLTSSFFCWLLVFFVRVLLLLLLLLLFPCADLGEGP